MYSIYDTYMNSNSFDAGSLPSHFNEGLAAQLVSCSPGEVTVILKKKKKNLTIHVHAYVSVSW